VFVDGERVFPMGKKAMVKGLAGGEGKKEGGKSREETLRKCPPPPQNWSVVLPGN